MIEITLHTRLVTSLTSTVRRAAGERTKWEAQRMATLALLMNRTMRPPVLPVQVTMTACVPYSIGRVDVSSTARPIIQGVADWFGIEHDDELIRWHFRRAHSERHAVHLTVEELLAGRHFFAPGRQQLTGLELR